MVAHDEAEETAPLISVIIPVHNMADSISACLAALTRQSIPRRRYEILVIDDGSSDGSGAVAERAGADRVIYKPRGGYAAAARNLGIRAAGGELLCFTDADCRPHPHWLEQITSPLVLPEIAGVKGVYTTDQQSLVARFVQLEYQQKYDRLRGQERISFIDFYSAAFRRQVLVSNEGFDERFPNSEDRELSFRLATRGYQMIFQPGAAVSHTHANTLVDYFKKKVRNGYWTAQVVRRFPTHGVDDSYTPQTMKLQILLTALLFMALGLTLLTLWASILVIVALVAFLLTTLPLAALGWQKDRPVALVAPFMQAVRATALGLGYAWGIVRPVDLDRHEMTAISGWNYIGKRGLDILAGMVGVLLTLVVLPIVALLNRGRGPLLQREVHLGQHGHEFALLSFAPSTPTRGRWRKLPQFWHILRGDMSLVGPCPETEEAVAGYQDWHRQRLVVKPGLVTPVPAETDCLDARVRLELEYIAGYSLWRDLRIVWREI